MSLVFNSIHKFPTMIEERKTNNAGTTMMPIFIEELTKISFKKITLNFFCAKYFIGGGEIKWKESKINIEREEEREIVSRVL